MGWKRWFGFVRLGWERGERVKGGKPSFPLKNGKLIKTCSKLFNLERFLFVILFLLFLCCFVVCLFVFCYLLFLCKLYYCDYCKKSFY